MSEQPPQQLQQSGSLLSQPQIIAAVIGGVITLIATVIGLLPTIMNQADPTPTAIVVTATPEPEEATFTALPPTATSIPPTATTQPTNTTVPPSATTRPPTTAALAATSVPQATVQSGNILLTYDEVALNLINEGAQAVSLEDVTFRSGNGEWTARTWGRGIYDNLQPEMCLRLRDSQAASQQPPPECAELGNLQIVDETALFWIEVSSFQITFEDEVIATCIVADETCRFNIETPANPIPLDG
jgi:hypothetical protein